MCNTWPGGYHRGMLPSEHEAWNAENYPGTLQLCSVCDEPTGRCEDDEMLGDDGLPLCEEHYDEHEARVAAEAEGENDAKP